MEQTTYYKLNLPSGEDYYNIEHQNENLRTLDAALFGRIGAGSYVGDGESERFIPLPRTPSFVLVMRSGSQFASENRRYGGMALEESPAIANGVAYLTVEEGGFRLKHVEDVFDGSLATMHVNSTGETYHYLWG
ncbi:MAG: hypothetical protein IJC88_04980 [Oscillospiraceae bacterium]|nr:hypothetical protein [Oscillospiraceae bacterium]